MNKEELDKVFGRIHSKVEDMILDMMDLLDEIDKLWAESTGRKGVGIPKPDWETLRKMRRDGFSLRDSK